MRMKKKAEMQRWERDGVTGSEEGNGEGGERDIGVGEEWSVDCSFSGC